MRSARSARSKKAPAEAASNYAWITSSRAIVSAMILAVVTAAMLTARDDVPRSDAERGEMTAAAVTFAPEPSLPLKPATLPAAKPHAVEPADPASPVAAMPVAASIVQPVERHEPEPEPEAETVAAATLTGCLERDGGAFRLTDATGSGAPTARSWKSGFLRKRTAHIDVADAVGTLSLRNHVGRRVAATGTLVDRELRAQSVRVVGPCD